MEAKVKAEEWLSSASLDDISRTAINNMSSEELNEAFYKNLEFGTGGLRGIMGVGSNRMNKYTVGMATQGFSNYLKQSVDGPIAVAIAHDSRNNSKEFAQITANVFSANGIKVFLFSELRPTPQLSFAIRELNCAGGVVITASHNPREYNGYKAYWSDGAQIITPHDQNIIKEVTQIQSLDDVNFDGDVNLIEQVGDEMDRSYLDMIKQLTLANESIQRHNDLKIVYSPIHGTGVTLIPKVLQELGFNEVHVVAEQSTPDGNFPTVVYPNPEEEEAMSMALQQAKTIDADLVMATDPDSDRVGIAVKNSKGEFQLLNGNQTGVLIVYYLLHHWEQRGLKGNEYIVKTIVTTELIKDIADSYGVESYDTLTGFKHIAALIAELENQKVFIGGGEESYGYMIGDKVRDKDAVASCVILAEMTAWAKDQDKSLFDLLMDIYKKYGLYDETLKYIVREGKQGAEEIEQMMAEFRSNPPQSLGGSPIIEVVDYQNLERKKPQSNTTERIAFTRSNVLQFITEDGTKISVRPSGTEPKIKFYISTRVSDDWNDYYLELEKLKKKAHKLLIELGL